MSEKRAAWSNKAEFVLSCMGYSVGLASIWRFPYFVYEYGGVSFLLPYCIMLLVVGLPCIYLELSIGLITQRGSYYAYKALCPLSKGIGMAHTIIIFLYCSYFSTICIYAAYYFSQSWHLELPWSSCEGRSWASSNCSTGNFSSASAVPATQEYFERFVLAKSAGMEYFGGLRWPLAACTVVIWSLIYLFIFKGTKWVGKIVYFTVIAPYVLILTLLVHSLTLPGATEGIEWYLGLNGKGDWSRIFDFDVWIAVINQVIFSLGLGCGGLIALSSYNKNNRHLLRDSCIILFSNGFTAITSGFLIFAILGHMAYLLESEVDKLATNGPELIFVTIPQVLSLMKPPYIWSIIFFFTLVLLGIDSIFASVEAGVTVLMDFIEARGNKCRRELLSALACGILLVTTLPFMFQGGVYLYTLVDWFVGQAITVTMAAEVIVACWVFNATRLCDEVEQLTGSRPSVMLKYLLMTTTPIICMFPLVMSIVRYQPVTYGDNYTYPLWCNIFGWMVAAFCIIFIPVCALHEYRQTAGDSFAQRVKRGLTATLGREKSGFSFGTPLDKRSATSSLHSSQ